MAATTFYVSKRVAEQLDENRRYYEDRKDVDGIKRSEDNIFKAFERIIAHPEQGATLSGLAVTHRRTRFERGHIYYRMNQTHDDVLIFWIKWTGQKTTYKPATLARMASEAQRERTKGNGGK